MAFWSSSSVRVNAQVVKKTFVKHRTRNGKDEIKKTKIRYERE